MKVWDVARIENPLRREFLKYRNCCLCEKLGWIPRETISEVERMGQMEDLKTSLITFKEKEISLHFSKIDRVIKISSAEL